MTKLITQLCNSGQQLLLCGGLKGLEKESLRINKRGEIAQTAHPYALGSALTHPTITTDYSEALIELITPPFPRITDTLADLHYNHQFVFQHLNDEILLSASMPCGIQGDESVQIANYGNSNIGRMKHVYRHGLWHRYGRTMQAIAGIHFNYSVPDALWPVLHQLTKCTDSLDNFISSRYFSLIRNFQRIGWIILYLFGASPALCKQFFNSRPELIDQFERFDDQTLYHPYATSLRMSDIGYKSQNQAKLNINYNSLDAYVESLTTAISTPYAEYEKIGILVDGIYKQLNSHLLQIENEFYSTIRPKQITHSCEKPTVALKRRGVRYVEMRSLDLDPFLPLGIDESKACFIEALLLTCLLTDSPLFTEQDELINNTNQLLVANEGRKPGVLLQKNKHSISLTEWAQEIIASMTPICQILDTQETQQPYQHALQIAQHCVIHPELTPSARLLNEMQREAMCFGTFALKHSLANADYFRSSPLDAEKNQYYQDLAQQSRQQQAALEAQPQRPFDQFLTDYFSQTCS